MAFPSVKLTTLASLAHRLPAACWLAQRLEQAPERWATLPVWWVEGDLDMAALDLVTTLSSDGQWLPPCPPPRWMAVRPPDGALLWVDGHLRLQGALTGGWHTPASAAEPSSPAVHALVMGDAQVHCALLRQGQLHVQGNLSVHTLLWGDGAPGGLTVLGQCAAQVGLFTRGYALQWNQPPSFDFTLQDADPAGDSALWQLADHETLGLVIPPQYLDADNAGTGSLAEMLNAPALVEAARAQQPADAAHRRSACTVAACPLLFPGRLHQRGQYQGRRAVTPDRTQAIHGRRLVWADPTFRCAANMWTATAMRGRTACSSPYGSNGTFTWGWTAPSPRRAGWAAGGAGSSACSSATAGNTLWCPMPAARAAHQGWWCCYRPMSKALPVHGPRWRWAMKMTQTPPPSGPASKRGAGCWTMCAKAPPRHARTTRCGRPCTEEITPARLTTLTSTPLFTERYNDWWDSEKTACG